MNHISVTILVVVILFQDVGVSGRRHDVMTSHKHKRRDLIVGARGTNHEHMTVEMQNNTEVVAQVDGTATIKCYTHFLGDEVVTWVKRDEDHILTAGGVVFLSESRYSVAHVRHQKLWELSIREVRKSDAGLYECQLSTHPKISLLFTLKVVEARAVIQGAPEFHVQTGNRLRLHCKVELATEPPEYIFWFHNNSMVNYESKRPLKVIKHHFGSSLTITNVTWDDAGAYRCEPHKADFANITLHVVAGEKQAALYKGQKDGGGENRASAASTSASHYLMTTLLVAAYYCLTCYQVCCCSLQGNISHVKSRL